jgi:exonuclease SbcC
MRINKISLRGFTTFREPASLDLEALGPGLIAFQGPNGAGKTTLLESIPGGIYRTSPSRGNVADLAVARDAQIELVGENGAPFTIRLDVDSHNGKSEAVLIDGNGDPLAGPKVRDYDRVIAEKFPPANVYLAAAFACQTGAGSLLKMNRAERRDLFSKLLGLDHLEDMAAIARERERRAEADMVASRAALEAITAGAGDIKALEAQVSEARASVEEARKKKVETAAALKSATDDLERLKSAADDAVRASRAVIDALEDKLQTARRALDAARQAKANAQARSKAADETLARLERRLAEISGILEKKDEIQTISRAIADLNDKLEKNRAAGEAAAAEERKAAEAVSAAERAEFLAAQALSRAKNDLAAAMLKKSSAEADINLALESTGAAPCAGVIDDQARGLCPALLGHFKTKAAAEAVLADLAQKIPAIEQAVQKAEADKSAASSVVSTAKTDAANVRARAESLRNEYRKLAGELQALKAKDRSAELNRAEAEASALKPQREDAENAANRARIDLDESGKALTSAASDFNQFDRDLAAVRSKAIEANGPEFEAARVLVRTAELNDQAAAAGETDAAKALAVKDSELSAALEAQRKADEIRDRLAPLEQDAAEWRFLARGLGREGIQALELDAAGPQVSTLANELLADAYGSRFQIRFETQAAKADGKGVKETFDIVVVDTDRGREGNGEDLSGGEKVIVGEALGLAVGLFHARSAGISLGTVVRDETVGALDPENAERYIAMLRSFVKIGSVHQLLFVCHQPALVDLADRVVRVEGGKIFVK